MPGEDDFSGVVASGDSAVDLGKMPPRTADDSGPSSEALQALLSNQEDIVEVLGEEGSGIRQRPLTDVQLPGGAEAVTKPDVVESAPPEGSGVPLPPPAGVDMYATVEDVIKVLPETAPSPQPPVASSAAETEQVIDVFPETQGPLPAESLFEVEPVPMAEPVSSPSVVPVAAEAVETPSERLMVAAPEALADETQLVSTLSGPESTPPAAAAPEVEEAAAVLDEEAGGTAEPASSASGQVYVATDAASGVTIDVAEVVSADPNLELESGIHKEKITVAAATDQAEDFADVVEVAETASGSMPAPALPADAAVAEEGAGVFDGEEILDVTEEASSAALGAAPASGRKPDSDVTVAEEAAESDVLDAEEVLDGAEASGKLASGVDVIAETLESGVDLANASPARRSRTSEVDLGGDEALEVSSSGVDLPGPASGGSGKKPGSSPALDEKSIEDLLMGPEEQLAGPPSGRVRGEAALADETLGEGQLPPGEEEILPAPAEAEAESAAEEEDEVKSPAKAKKGARTVTGARRPALYVGGGVLLGLLLLGGIAAGAWFVARDTVMDLLAVQKKQPPPAPSPLQMAHDFMDQGDYERALSKLEGAGEVPAVQSTRAQARWLNYLKDTKTIDGKSPEVVKALEESKAAKNDALRRQITTALEAQQQSAQLGKVEKDLTVLQEARDKTAKDITAIAQALVDSKQIQDAKDFNVSKVPELLKALGEANGVVTNLATELKVKPEAVAKVVKELVAARTAVDAQLKEVDEKLAEAKIEVKGPAGVAKLVDARNKLDKERADLDSAVKTAFDVLKSESLTPAGAEPRKGLLEATKMAVEKARAPVVISLAQVASVVSVLGADVGGMLQRTFDTAKLVGELAYYRTREPLIQSPEQRLDMWIALLQDRGHKAAADLTAATNEAQWVLADPRASAVDKAKAQFVLGLADRNRGRFAQASKALDQAIKAAAAAKADAWAKTAAGALRELTDPTAYYLPEAERLHAAGELKAALANLDTAVQVNPQDGRVHALRGLVRLELLPTGKLDPATQQLVRQDAEAARKDSRTAAEGAYVLGRLDEELGNFDGAEKQYRAALAVFKGSSDEASRYVIALARVLQRERGLAPEAPAAGAEPKAPSAKEPKVEQPSAPSPEDAPTSASAADPRPALLVLALLGFQADDEDENPEQAGRLRESVELAKKLINSADPKIKGQGYILLGQALTRQGKRTEGLQYYVKGMQLAYPGAPTRELLKLVEEHPAFQESGRVGPPNSLLAERHFGKGLHDFWQGQYPAAEEQFRKTVAYFDQDARFHYYLGLACLLQGTKAKRQQARYNFDVGARLERENRPGPVAVNASLERLQGQLRQYLDDYRQKAP